jgi:hypothetical protein
MFSLISQRFAARVLVRAFTTSYTLPAARTLATTNNRFRFLTTSGAASVEEDLDAALDTILGDAFLAADAPKDLENEADMNDSHPVPEEVIEEVSSVNVNEFMNCSVVCLSQTYNRHTSTIPVQCSMQRNTF